MLDEIQLLVAGAGPEIFADIDLNFALDLSFAGHKRDAGFLAEGRIGQHQVEILAQMGRQAVSYVDGAAACFGAIAVGADSVQAQVHHA